MRTEGALTPAPPPGFQREDSRARGSPLPTAGWSPFPQDSFPVSTMVKKEERKKEKNNNQNPEFGSRGNWRRGSGCQESSYPLEHSKNTNFQLLCSVLKCNRFVARVDGAKCASARGASTRLQGLSSYFPGLNACPKRPTGPGPREERIEGIVTPVIKNQLTPRS